MKKYLFENTGKNGKLLLLLSLIAACFFVSVVVNIYFGLDTVYTQLYYIPVILAGLWFHRAAYLVAGFLGGTHIVINYIASSGFDLKTLLRFTILTLVAGIIGNVALRMDMLDKQAIAEKEKASLLNNSVQDIIGRMDDSGFIHYISPSVKRVLGYSPEEVKTLSLFELIHPDERESVSGRFKSSVRERVPVSLEFRVLSGDGQYVWLEALLNPAACECPDGDSITFSCRDISRRKKDEEIIKNISITDPLTGLKNRRFLDAVMENEMARSTRYSQKVSVVMVDLDHFKYVNDTYGHPVGDQVLIRTAGVIGASIRNSDVLARLGGEEFMILLPRTDVFGAFSVAEKIRKNIEAEVHPQAGFVTASFGVAERYENESVNELYKRVDDALYLAKERGRNRVAVFENNGERPVAYVRLDWHPSMACGEKTVDSQHAYILEIANALIAAALTRAAKEDISEKLDLLLSHIKEHFEYEEEAQRKAGYPDWNAHAAIHSELIEKALDLKKSFDGDTIKVTDLFSFMVDDVVYGHMMVEDIKFYPYFQTNL